MPVWGWVLIVLLVLVIALIVLSLLGNKMQEKQLAQKEQMVEAAQPVTMLVIDKKIMPIKDAKLPKIVTEQLEAKGKRYTKAKVPIVKAKVGPQILSLICDDAIFEDVPSRGEVKAMVSGIYLVSVKQIRGKNKNAATAEDDKKKKKGGFRQRLLRKQAAYQRELSEELANKKSKEEIKAEKLKKKKDAERAKKITV